MSGENQLVWPSGWQYQWSTQQVYLSQITVSLQMARPHISHTPWDTDSFLGCFLWSRYPEFGYSLVDIFLFWLRLLDDLTILSRNWLVNWFCPYKKRLVAPLCLRLWYFLSSAWLVSRTCLVLPCSWLACWFWYCLAYAWFSICVKNDGFSVIIPERKFRALHVRAKTINIVTTDSVPITTCIRCSATAYLSILH